jgi:cytochrome c peroxidase
MKNNLLARLGVVLVATAGIAIGPVLSDTAIRDKFARPLTIPFPNDRAYDPQIATLGKMLYFDPRLSGAQNMSCSSCHNPSFGWETPVETAVGAMNTRLGRHAPTIINMAWVHPYFWDGRADTLEEQAAGPITAEVEMNATFEEVIHRLGQVDGYREWFNRLFPDEGISQHTITLAIATFERTVISGWSTFDRWVEGDEDAISDAAKRGFDLFVGKASCVACHAGWNFTDNAFHDIGLYTQDIGLAARKPDDPYAMHAFKTPGLRNIALRAPYMHNGSIGTLRDVVAHYASGGLRRPSLSPDMTSLDLSEQDIDDLVAFLETLTEEATEVPTPILPAN